MCFSGRAGDPRPVVGTGVGVLGRTLAVEEGMPRVILPGVKLVTFTVIAEKRVLPKRSYMPLVEEEAREWVPHVFRTLDMGALMLSCARSMAMNSDTLEFGVRVTYVPQPASSPDDVDTATNTDVEAEAQPIIFHTPPSPRAFQLRQPLRSPSSSDFDPLGVMGSLPSSCR
jgi:hypothetical protein